MAIELRKTAVVCSALFLLALFAFLPAVRHDFSILDDDQYVTANSMVKQGLTLEGFRWAFTSSGYAYNWHPVTWLSHMLDVELFGLNPAGHHLASLLIHALNTALLFVVLRAGTGALWRSAAVAALFGVHPLRVESVVWVAERKDVLSAFFWIVLLLGYLHYARRPGWKRYAAVWLLLAVGLMAKPMLVTVPLVLLLLDYWPLGRVAVAARSARSRSGLAACLLEKVALLPLVAASAAMTVSAQATGGALAANDITALPGRLGRALMAAVHYVGVLFWPVDLAVYYPLPPVSTAPAPASLMAAGLAVAVIATIALVRSRRQPYLPVGLLWYLGTLLPVVGLVQVGGQAMADRYTYLPLVGIVLMIVWSAAAAVKDRPRLAAPLAGLFAVALAALVLRTAGQVRLWSDDALLFRHTLDVTQNNWFAHNNLGMILDKRGRHEEAKAHILESLRIKPDYAVANFNIGFILVREGDLPRAVPYLRRALFDDPAFALAANRLAGTLLALGSADEAEKVLTDFLVVRPDYALGHSNLGTILHRKGRLPDAIGHYREALRLDQTLVTARRGLANAERGLPP